MPEFEIRPSVKFVGLRAIIALFVVLVVWGIHLFGPLEQRWVAEVVSLLLLWPLPSWLRTRSNVTYLGAERLRSESGVFSRSSRNLVLARIQDVGVTQSFRDRIFGVGDVWIETAGVSSRVVLEGIDSPRAVADRILDASRRAG